jgi:hypothetical protein
VTPNDRRVVGGALIIIIQVLAVAASTLVKLGPLADEIQLMLKEIDDWGRPK